MITYVEVDEREILLLRTGTGSKPSREHGEQTFYERAGFAARPVLMDGMLWQRLAHRNGWRAYADIPSPEGMLL